MFGKKKPSVFDVAQDQQLKALIKNQQIMIPNQNSLIKDGKIYWSWIQTLSKRVKSLESTILSMQETDKKFAQMFQGLASLSASKAEVETSES